ncbi:hypothetical protein PaecuDRAFT_3582 [Paenibacillus curdlanolyticus YK9]|uniref:Uncharacterized protein n=1 Tax=Paenibacillus curdlanolyticus YK9 TaxID=717606 RepID=E0ID80_9BACL|nr:hypothetical protein [Paenibacillus curdlanolyticus]EFM09535.1 hypothetical protein PaecuDRAFT_3582 [Paenibacillus curdlanolyticus YK9]
MDFYGHEIKRKRSIDLGGTRNESSFGLNWESESKENDLKTGLNISPQTSECPTTELDGQKINEEQITRSPHFGNGYQKVTVYLPVQLFEVLKKEKQMRRIRSFSEAITHALSGQFSEHNKT